MCTFIIYSGYCTRKQIQRLIKYVRIRRSGIYGVRAYLRSVIRPRSKPHRTDPLVTSELVTARHFKDSWRHPDDGAVTGYHHVQIHVGFCVKAEIINERKVNAFDCEIRRKQNYYLNVNRSISCKTDVTSMKPNQAPN